MVSKTGEQMGQVMDAYNSFTVRLPGVGQDARRRSPPPDPGSHGRPSAGRQARHNRLPYAVDAADLDEAIAWAAKIPGASMGDTIEVRPIMKFD